MTTTEETATSPDPTPILTAIGQLRSPAMSNERFRVVFLGGQAVAWQLQWFLTGTVAALIPWTTGRPGVIWSVALFGILFLCALVSVRYTRKRGVVALVSVKKGVRKQSLVRMSLWITILVVACIGNVRALGDDTPIWQLVVLMLVGVVLGVLIVMLINRRRRRFVANLQASAVANATPTDQSTLPPPMSPPNEP